MKVNNKKGLDMHGGTAYDTYVENSVGIESPTKLIEMLYEGVLRFNAQAKKAIKDGNIEKKVYWLNRSVAIVTELLSILDMKQEGTVVKYLEGIYNYEIQLLMESSIDGDITKLDEVNNVFKGLLAAWKESTDVA